MLSSSGVPSAGTIGRLAREQDWWLHPEGPSLLVSLCPWAPGPVAQDPSQEQQRRPQDPTLRGDDEPPTDVGHIRGV